MSHPLIYEINTRCWLRQLSGVHGRDVTLGEVPETEFDRWRQLGFTHIWLMGVWSTGPRARNLSLLDDALHRAGEKLLPGFSPEDIAGSPYAVADYHVAAALGGDEGLRNFRRRLGEFGLKLILDFVPNHLGLDHRWVVERPELFVQSHYAAEGTFSIAEDGQPPWLAHGRDPYFPPWTDTVQLDYRRPATRRAVIDELDRVATLCDGVRCDMAMLLLNEVFGQTWRRFPSSCAIPEGEFWKEAIATVRMRHPGFMFIAEVYWDMQEPLHAVGFDYMYYKELYDAVIRREPDWMQRRLHDVSAEFLTRSVHFLENHDEPRVASLFTAHEQRAATILLLGLPGMRLLHDGQLDGARRRLPVHFGRRPMDDIDPQIADFHVRLLTALRETAIGRGHWQFLKLFGVEGESLGKPHGFVGIQWQSRADAFDLVLVNFSPRAIRGRLVPEIDALPERRWTAADLLTGHAVAESGAEWQRHGLSISLPGHTASLLHITS